MPSDAIQLLEYPQLLSLIAQYTGSPLGRAKVLSFTPLPELSLITERLELAAEAREHLRLQRSPQASPASEAAATSPLRFSGIEEPGAVLAKIHVQGTVLEIPEIMTLLRLADAAETIRRTLLASRR